ncbi:MAG: YcgN family cysteine cluster protein [Chloroflexota bacterium]|nr:YcgN family cysteine cluster protein [Chloroflexota bacterium]
MKENLAFWQVKSLSKMTYEEWEMLCDGCAKCCLHKIEDQDGGKVYFTNIACRLLDCQTCRCQDYDQRTKLIPDCVSLTPARIYELQWLPESCAYRRLAEGRGLAWWHPLVSGDLDTVRQANISVCDRVIPESLIDLSELEEYIVDWFE